MFLMYADESGDPGLTNSPTKHFALSGIVVHESRWRDLVQALIDFRRAIKSAHGLPVRTEIHSSAYLQSPPIPRMSKHTRFLILRNFIDELAKLDYISITSVIIDKTNKPADYDVFDNAWKLLFQRFENTLIGGNMPGGHRQASGVVFVDNTNGTKLNRMMRKMAVYNMIPSMIPGYPARNLPILRVIEDPNMRDSTSSLIIQAADVVAYFLKQKYETNKYFRKNGAKNYYDKLRPVLNVYASRQNPLGIVAV